MAFTARILLIPGVTDTSANLTARAGWRQDGPSLTGVDLLPYNPVAGAKYVAVGLKFNPGGDEKRPDAV